MQRVWGNVTKMVTGLAMVGTLFGCAGLQPKTLDTGTRLSKELRVRAHGLDGVDIPDSRVADAIGAALIAGGEAPKSYNERYLNTYQGHDSYWTSGVQSKMTPAGIEVTYLNGANYHQSRISATFPLAISKSANGDLYQAVLGFPAKVDMTPPEFVPLVPDPEYALKEDQVLPNLLSKFNALDTVSVTATATIKGEVTVAASTDAVRGNLERILGKYPDMESHYSFDVKGHREMLGVKLYPYKSGCKAQYLINVDYSVSESTSLTQADIDAIRQKIESVFKD